MDKSLLATGENPIWGGGRLGVAFHVVFDVVVTDGYRSLFGLASKIDEVSR